MLEPTMTGSGHCDLTIGTQQESSSWFPCYVWLVKLVLNGYDGKSSTTITLWCLEVEKPATCKTSNLVHGTVAKNTFTCPHHQASQCFRQFLDVTRGTHEHNRQSSSLLTGGQLRWAAYASPRSVSRCRSSPRAFFHAAPPTKGDRLLLKPLR